MKNTKTKRTFVQQLPDLIEPSEYTEDSGKKRIKLRIRVSSNGVKILGDSQYPVELEKILEQLSPETIEQVLCG